MSGRAHQDRWDFRLIGFGALIYMFSGVGQSYLFQFIRPDVVETFALTQEQFGRYYLMGTLASGFLIMFSGRIFDWLDLRLVTVIVVIGAALSCFFFASTWAVWVLVPAIFLQRQFGQGLMNHIPSATMARYFTNLRGRATGICNASYSLGEAIIPAMAGVLILWLGGWRGLYWALGCFLLAVILPLSLWLLRGHDARHRQYLQRQQDDENGVSADGPGGPGTRRRQWTLGEVLRNPTIWMILPTLVGPSFVFTGLVIFGLEYATELEVTRAQWTLLWSLYAIFQFAMTFPLGWLVDRVTATRLVPFIALPMALGLIVVQPFTGIIIGGVMLVLWGLGQGFTAVVLGPLFAELYGARHLGTIKAAYTSAMVIASAGGPFVVGTLLERGMSLKGISLWLAGYILVSAIVAGIAVSRLRVKPLARG